MSKGLWPFRAAGSSSGVDPIIKKFLDVSRDPVKRMKSFKQVLDKLTLPERKEFMTKHQDAIYFVFYSSFVYFEGQFHATRSAKKSSDTLFSDFSNGVLPMLEAILLLLPEKIHEKWQYNSICTVIYKMLHPENVMSLRFYGIKLLILFMLDVQEHVDDACLELFATAVPQFPPPLVPEETDGEEIIVGSTSSVVNRYGPYCSEETSKWWDLSPGLDDIGIARTRPLYPEVNQAILKMPRTKLMMEYLLSLLTGEVGRAQWSDPAYHRRGFAFLFYQFQLKYLVPLYKDFRQSSDIYAKDPPTLATPTTLTSATALSIALPDATPTSDMPPDATPTSDMPPDATPTSDMPPDITPTSDMPPDATPTSDMPPDATPTSDMHPDAMPTRAKVKPINLHRMSSVTCLTYDTSAPVYREIRSLILEKVLQWLNGVGPEGSLTQTFMSDLSTSVSLSNSFPSKVNGTNLARQTLFSTRDNIRMLLEMCCQCTAGPASQSPCLPEVVDLYRFWIECEKKPIFMEDPTPQQDEVDASMAWEHIRDPATPQADLRAGLQPTLQVIIRHAKEVFYIKHEVIMNRSELETQVMLCRKVIDLYQCIMKRWLLSEESWLYLLNTLLEVTFDLLQGDPPSPDTKTLATELAPQVLETLLVSFVRASVTLTLPTSLWNSLLDTLSQRTQWTVVVDSWKLTMDDMTRVLSQVVYKLDLNALPLEQESMRTRAGGPSKLDNRHTSLGEVSTDPGTSSHARQKPEVATPPPFHFPISPTVTQVRPVSRKISLLRSRSHNIDGQSSSPAPTRPGSTAMELSFDIPSPTSHIPASAASYVPPSGSVTPNAGALLDEPHSFVGSRGPLRKAVSEHVLPKWEGSNKETHPTVFGNTNFEELPSLVGLVIQEERDLNGNDDSAHQDEVDGSTLEESDRVISISKGEDPRNISSGWTPEVAAMVWLRMLGILGDVTKIPHPMELEQVMKQIEKIWINLEKIEHNSAVAVGKDGSSDLPPFLPPLLLFLSWTLCGCGPSEGYLATRLVSYELLCRTVIRRWIINPPFSKMMYFYHAMKESLHDTNTEVLCTVIRHASCMFVYSLPSSTLLVDDAVMACSRVLKEQGPKVPRYETLVLLGSLLFQSPNEMDKVISMVMKSACNEQTIESRCLALHQLGLLVFHAVSTGHNLHQIDDVIQIVITSAHFVDETVAMTAIDVINLWYSIATKFTDHHTKVIIQGVSYATSCCLKGGETVPSSPSVLIALFMTFRDWITTTPISWLQQAHIPVLLQMLEGAMTPNWGSFLPVLTPPSTTVELSPIHLSKSLQHTSSGGSRHVPFDSIDALDPVQATAKSIIPHLNIMVNHYPLLCGPAQYTSSVNEIHDYPSLGHHDNFTLDTLQNSHMQFLLLNNSSILSVSEHGMTADEMPTSPSLVANGNRVRLIARCSTGRFSWDVRSLSLTSEEQHTATQRDNTAWLQDNEQQDLIDGCQDNVFAEVDPPSLSLSVSLDQPPSYSTFSEGDILDQLLMYIGGTSEECLQHDGQLLNQPAPCPSIEREDEDEERLLSELLEQEEINELGFWKDACYHQNMLSEPVKLELHESFPLCPFGSCRQLISQLGWLDWHKRSKVDLLQKSDQLIRQVKFLDRSTPQCRQIYKVAVLYVAHDMENQKTILTNEKGSKMFEEFVSALGWEVNLGTHKGYMGGLSQEFAQHMTAPYYATVSEEVLFHVSTRMKCALNQKIRHLGNDEIHIVWSEHYRDYHRSVFKTQFAGVLIIIYPLPSGLCRVHIIKKPKVPQFGPLYDGALVPFECLGGLVRATAINACLRINRHTGLDQRGRYNERQLGINHLTQSCKLLSSFEEFGVSLIHPCYQESQHSSDNSASMHGHHGNLKGVRPAESVQELSPGPPGHGRRRANTFSGVSSKRGGEEELSRSLKEESIKIEQYESSPKLSRNK